MKYITLAFKKGYSGSKDNYQPVTILPAFSKLFEKRLCKQSKFFIDPLLPKFSCAFRKDYFLVMLKQWKSEADKRKLIEALLTDLSKAFDCFSHKLIIAKLNIYGFSLSALKLVQNCPSKRQQRTKFNQS